MPQKMISHGQLCNLPGICYGNPEMEYNPVFTSIIEAFFENGDRPLQEAIDHDMTAFNVPDNLLLWTIARATIVDSYVLRLFAADCIEHAAPQIFADESYDDVSVLPIGEHPSVLSFVGEVVACARNYAKADCDHEMLMATNQKVVNLMVAEGIEGHHAHFLNVCRHVLDPHPDGGAIQCIMQIPRCLEQIGIASEPESYWQRYTAFRGQCEAAGFFDEA